VREKLAIEGGPKAAGNLTPEPYKLGADELWALVDLWEMPRAAKERLRKLIFSEAALAGPHLFRYYGKRPSQVALAEKLMAETIGVKHCLAVNSCTSALIASLRALGIGAGDEVIVPAFTFLATASAVVACNAVPVICEVDDSLNLDAEAARKLLTRRTKALAAVHMRGAPAQMDAIMELAGRKGLAVVEDVAQACGGSFRGKRLGAIGTMGCFSFDYYKIAVSGEGGFVTTDDDYLFLRAQSWHDTAACWRPDRYAAERVKGELFCGENYRMSELQGAVAAVQIRKIGPLLARCRRNATRIRAEIGEFPGLSFRRLTDPRGDTGMVLIFFLASPALRAKVVPALRAEGVPAASAYSSEMRGWHIYCYCDYLLKRNAVARDGLPWSAIPKRELPKYSKRMCPRTLDYLSRSVSVGIAPHYTAADCRKIAQGINKVLGCCL